MKEKKAKATNLVSFRLTDEEYQPIKNAIENSTLTKTEICRAVFLNQQFTFNLKQSKPVDYNKLIFIFNKASNNINQIAKVVNTENQKGTLTDEKFNAILNKLITLESYLNGFIESTD